MGDVLTGLDAQSTTVPHKRRLKSTGGTRYSLSVVLAYFKAQGIPEPVPEYRFFPDRKFRFDFAWPQQGLALEVEGGIFTHGAHGSISGMLRDGEKYNLAATFGFRVLRILPDKLCMNETAELVKKCLAIRS